jgi:hypothetical protein
LFLPNLLESPGSGKLRIFGDGYYLHPFDPSAKEKAQEKGTETELPQPRISIYKQTYYQAIQTRPFHYFLEASWIRILMPLIQSLC